MKKRMTGLVLLCVALYFVFLGHALADTWLTDTERVRMRNLIGEYPSGAAVRLTASSTAKEVISGLDDLIGDVTADDTLVTLLRLLEETEESSVHKQRMLEIRNQLETECIQPLTYHYEQLSGAALRLENLLDLLEDPDAGLNELETARYASECRFLEDLIKSGIREVSTLQESAAAASAKAEADIEAMRDEVHAAVGSVRTSAAETSRSIQAQEQAALTQVAQGLTASFQDTKADAGITVIDGTQFAVLLTTGPGEKDVLTDTEVTAISMKGNAYKVKTDQNGVASFDIKDFPFDNKKGRAYLSVSAKGYRKVVILNARVQAGKAYTIPMTKDDGKPYVMEASIKGDDMLFDADNGICYIMNSKVMYVLSFRLANMPKNASGKLYLKLLDPKVAADKQLEVEIGDFTTDENGETKVSKEDSYAGKLQVKEKGAENAAGMMLIAKDGNKQEIASFKLAQKIERAAFEDPISLNPTLPSLTPGMLSLKLPSLDPVFKNPSVDIGMPMNKYVSVLVDVDGSFVFTAGIKANPNLNQTSVRDGNTEEDRNTAFDEIGNKCREQIERYEQKAANDNTDGDVKKVALAKGFKFDFKLAGGVVGKLGWLDNYQIKDRIPFKGTAFAGVSVGFSYRYTQQFLYPGPPPFPYYAGFDVKLSVSAGAQITIEGALHNKGDLYQDELKMTWLADANIAPRLDVGVCAGIGVSDLLSIGVRGYGSFTAAFDFVAPLTSGVSGNIYWQLIIGAGLDVEARALLWSVSAHLISASWKINDTPTPFYDETKKLSRSVSGSRSESQLRTAMSGQKTDASLNDLPAKGEVIALGAKMQGVRAVGAEEDAGGIAPEREILFDGRFDMTNLKAVTVDNGQGGYVDFVFSAGNKNTGDPGYESIMYASSEGDSLELRGAIYAEDMVSPWPDRPKFDYTFLMDFDVSYNTIEKLVFVLGAYGFADQTADGPELYGTALHVQAYTLAEDGKTLTKLYEHSMIPRNENGNPLRVKLIKPTVSASDFKSELSGETFNSCGIAAVGTDLDDRDVNGQALGHDRGSYLYLGGADPDGCILWRYNTAKLEDNDEAMQIIFLPAAQTFNYKSNLAFLEAALLTGVTTTEKTEDGGERQVIDSNRLYIGKLLLMTYDDMKAEGYLPRDMRGLYNTYGYRRIDDLRVSNIMPGLEDYQMLVVRAVEDSEPTEDGGRESTLDGYTFTSEYDRDLQFDKVNYGFTTSMNWFGTARVAGGRYLYWLQDYDADANDPNGSKARHVIRCCLYDKDDKCFTDPFDLVELSWSPRTVALGSGSVNRGVNATGLYTVAAPDNKDGEQPAWSFVDVDYKLKSSLDFVSFAGLHCVTAGEQTTFVTTVENTGNTLIASFDVKLSDEKTGEKLGDITIDATNPKKCSVRLYDLNGREDDEPVYTGDWHTVYNGNTGTYGGTSRLVLTTQSADGTVGANEVVSLGIVPGHTVSYDVGPVKIPESWAKSNRTILAEIHNLQTPPDDDSAVFVSQQHTEDLDQGMFSEREVAAAMEAVAPAGLRSGGVQNHSKKSSIAVPPVYEDLKLDLNLVDFPDGTYVEALITSVNDTLPTDASGLKSAKPPTLTFTKVSADGEEEITFRHTFVNPITAKRGYTMLIPLDLLDGDGNYAELVGTVTGNSGYEEYFFYNNTETIYGNQYSITVLTEGPGQAYAQNSAGKQITTALSGDKIQLIALPDAGASFVEWRTDGPEIGEDGSFLMPAHSVTVTAVFGAPLLIVKDPEDVWINSGEQGTFEVIASGEGLTYQWYVNTTHPESRNTKDGWVLLPGATKASYTTDKMTRKADGYLYRCVVTDKYGRQVTSGAAMLHVKLPLTGDQANPVLWLTMVLIGTGIILVIQKKNQQPKQK